MADLTTTLPPLTPPNPFEEMSGIYAGRQPRREFELESIKRRIEEAGLQQKASQEKRAQQDQRMKQFSAYATIAKVVNSMGDAIPAESKSAIAQKFADEALADNMPVTDKRFFDALMNQPNELAKFLTSYQQAKQQGDDDITALTKGSQNLTDPEVQKTVSETFQKLVTERAKPTQPKLGDLKALAVQLEVGGSKEEAKTLRDAIKDIEATPQGAESRIFDALVAKHRQAGAANPTLSASEEFLGFVGQRSQAGAAGKTAGEPLPTPIVEKVADLDSALTKATTNLRIFNPKYVGGPAGAVTGNVGAITGALREKTGMIGGDEVTFRQNTFDLQDMLLRARSGAQINEQEYKRLSRIAPNITDQPVVYKQKLENFVSTLKAIRDEKVRLAKTPKGTNPPLSALPQPPPGFIPSRK